MNILLIAWTVNTDAGGRTFVLYGDKGFAIDPQIITPYRYVEIHQNKDDFYLYLQEGT